MSFIHSERIKEIALLTDESFSIISAAQSLCSVCVCGCVHNFSMYSAIVFVFSTDQNGGTLMLKVAYAKVLSIYYW